MRRMLLLPCDKCSLRVGNSRYWRCGRGSFSYDLLSVPSYASDLFDMIIKRPGTRETRREHCERTERYACQWNYGDPSPANSKNDGTLKRTLKNHAFSV